MLASWQRRLIWTVVATVFVTRSDSFCPLHNHRRLVRPSFFGITARPTEFVADESTSVQSLYEWLESFEGTNVDALAVGSSSEGRRGLYATKSVSEGEMICSIASDCAMALQNPSKASLDMTSIPQDAQAFLKGYWKNPDVRKLWAPYLDTLPTNVTTPTPDMYSEEQLWLLEFPRLVNQATARRDEITKLARVASMTLKELEWASWIISSRSIPLVVSEQPAKEDQPQAATKASPDPPPPPQNWDDPPPKRKFHNRDSGKHSYYERGAVSEKVPFATWIIQPESLNIRPHENDVGSDFAERPPINQRQQQQSSYFYPPDQTAPRQQSVTPSWVMDPQNFAIPTDNVYGNGGAGYGNGQQQQSYAPEQATSYNPYPAQDPPPFNPHPATEEEPPTTSQAPEPPLLDDDKVEENDKKENPATDEEPASQEPQSSYLPPRRNQQQPASYLPIIEEQHPPVRPSWVINPKAFSIPSEGEYSGAGGTGRGGSVDNRPVEKETPKPAEGNRFLSQRQASVDDSKADNKEEASTNEERPPANQKSYLPPLNQRRSSYLPPLDQQKPNYSPSWVINPKAFSIPENEFGGRGSTKKGPEEEMGEPKDGNRFLQQRKSAQDDKAIKEKETTTEKPPPVEQKESPPRKGRKDMEWSYDDRGQVVASNGRRNYIRVLTPLLDMANHASKEANAKFVLQSYDGKEDALIGLEAIRPIKAGEEVTVEYGGGMASSVELLGNYGFVDEENTQADAEMLRKGGDDCFKTLDEWTTLVEEDENMLEDLPVDDVSNLRTILQFWVQVKKSYAN